MKRPPKKKQKSGRSPGPNRVPPSVPVDDDGISERADAIRLQLKRLDGNRFALQAPVCAQDRQEDLDEVHAMIAAGELEIARDELLYLVSDCRGFLEAHNRLGELALEEADLSLARGHFGFAFEIGIESLPKGFRGVLPSTTDYNTPFFLAGRGLARCLIARGQKAEGRNVLEQLSRFDPRDETIGALLAELDEAEQRKKPGRT
jgi:hypothetical protein